jgi:hypothetical protein
LKSETIIREQELKSSAPLEAAALPGGQTFDSSRMGGFSFVSNLDKFPANSTRLEWRPDLAVPLAVE